MPSHANGDYVISKVQQRLIDVFNEGLVSVAGYQRPRLRIEGYISESSGANGTGHKILVTEVDLSDLVQPRDSSDRTSNNGDDGREPGSVARETSESNSERPETRSASSDDNLETAAKRKSKRRRATGGLRLPNGNDALDPRGPRQLQSTRYFPKRSEKSLEGYSLQPSTVNGVIEGIWSRIHENTAFEPALGEWHQIQSSEALTLANEMQQRPQRNVFKEVNLLCRKVMQVSRGSRALELIVQAHWVDCFEERISQLKSGRPNTSPVQCRMLALKEACEIFGQSEKVMRNKISVWKGYNQIKNAGGYVALVFAGMGIYRFCKYRIGFEEDAFPYLRALRPRFELAADTLHPNWRRLLAIVGESIEPAFTGHPLAWTVVKNNNPQPLAKSYVQQELNFEFVTESIIDENEFYGLDPRRFIDENALGLYSCSSCGETQSDNVQSNQCRCFPALYGEVRSVPPVQIFKTNDGRNNGLIACCSFPRGTAIGEFVGLVTRGLDNTDVMEGVVKETSYQIWQGRQGNHTKFVNHSCVPNSQYQKFVWLGVERIVLVSKGIQAGSEITVDYSDRYWENLDKLCLCGESACRFRNYRLKS